MAAVKWRAKHAEQHPLSLPLTDATLAGIRREGADRGRGQVAGLTWSLVERVCIHAEWEGSLSGLRDSALIRLMSDCLLRVSEAVAVNLGDLKGKTLTLRESKTDQTGEGVSLSVCDATRAVLQQYAEAAEIKRGALFRHIRRGGHIQKKRLSDVSARRIIKARAKSGRR